MKKQTIIKITLSICLSVVVNIFPGKASPTENSVSQQQGLTVAGTVKDPNGIPLIGVSVAIAGSRNGTVTDVDGHYSVTISGEKAELRFSYLGFQSQTVKVGTQKTIDITLSEDVTVLDDVVIVAYGTQKKETIVGALASVSAKDLLQSPQANISNALVGRLPGLIAVQRSGQPGRDASTIRIRGIGTFAQKNQDRPDDPDPQDPLIMVDGIESSNFNDIDPSEIESFTILKDASATAVYGVRGANGVVLITTRRGAAGKPRISFSTNVAATNFPFLRKNQNSYDYTRTYNEALKYDSYVTGSYAPRFTEEDIEQFRLGTDPVNYPSTDWYEYLLRKFGYQTRTNFNVSGGTDKLKYFLSLGYFTQEGMFNTSIYDPGYNYQAEYKRYNLRSNIDVDVTKNFKVSFDISTQIGDIRDPQWSMGGLFEGLSSSLPFASPKVMDNHIVTNKWGGTTPMTPFDKGWKQTYENNLNGSVRLNYKMDYLLKGLALRGAVSYRNFNSDIKDYRVDGMNYIVVDVEGESKYLTNSEPKEMQTGWDIGKNTRIYLEAGLDYARTFGNHTVTGLVLYNQTKFNAPWLEFNVPNGYQGIVGRITYNFKHRYLAEYNIGYNGTENFDVGKRFGFFPAYSLGWVLSEESFFPKNDVATFIKFRGSYGSVGNDKIGGDRFLYRPTTFIRPNVQYGLNAGSNPSSYFWGEGQNLVGHLGYLEGKIGNPDLTWERADKLDAGVDLKLWKDKINITFDYFKETRNNILWNRQTVPAIIGANMPAYNLGKMQNTGWEGEISYYDKIRDFQYFIKGNYTYAHNQVIYKDEVVRTYSYRYETGQRFGQFFGLVADGLYNTWEEVNDPNRPVYQWSNNLIQPGDIRYVDINGDGIINDNDQAPIGYSNFPEVIFGFSVGGEWKGFDFSVLFQGADKVSNMPSRRTIQGYYTNTGANADLLKSWTRERYEAGLPIVYPRYAADYGNHNYQWSTYWLEDASYVRLKNAEIGYTFRGEILNKAGINSVRLYANGSNLITWANMFPGEDPEFPTGENNSEPYPLTRVFNLGLNVNF